MSAFMFGPIGRRESRGYRLDIIAFAAGYHGSRDERWCRLPGPRRTAYQAGWRAAIADAATGDARHPAAR